MEINDGSGVSSMRLNGGDVPDAILEEIVLSLTDDWSRSMLWDMHFLVKTKQMSLEDLWSAPPLVPPISAVQLAGDSWEDYSRTSSSMSLSNAQCQICQDEVSGSRFAAHLNKCFYKAKKAKLNGDSLP